MVLTASSAVSLTNSAVTSTNSSNLRNEVSIAEDAIRSAASAEFFEVIYNARIIGNPIGDPNINANLQTATQVSFRDLLLTAGYQLGFDTDTGYWKISWKTTGAEQFVSVYLVLSTLSNITFGTASSVALTGYFATLTPVVHPRIIVESATIDAKYGYVAIAEQPDNSVDHRTAILNALIVSGNGYSSGNTSVQKVG